MPDNEKKQLDLNRIFHYKNLSNQNRKIIIGVCVAIFVVTSFVQMQKHLNRPKKEKISTRTVKISPVIKKNVPIYINSFGTLVSPEDVDIKSQVTGKIKEVCFEEGQNVLIGDQLFIIDPSEYEAHLHKAEATLLEDEAELKLKKDILLRNVGLLEKELISQQEFEKYETDVAVTAAKVEVDKAEIELAKINLRYCYIVSPINGVTGVRQVDPGNIVSANTGPVLVNVKQIDTLYMDFTIPEKELPRVRKTMAEGILEVVLTVTGDDTSSYTGKLDFLENSVDDRTGRVLLRAIVDNKDRALWPGQFAKVQLILGTIKNAVLAPYSAVQLGQKGSYLFVIDEQNKAELKLVTVGQKEEDYIVIEKGVKVGERAVTTGQMGLRPGVPVKIID
ncbi:MAG: efflux RND transporter periplasmic adaptor subunit [Candidatus Omnitrophica bacterium]|nr:efflux RND transporter periplasmic adaptor subunit [Candidatus Omnitrophota bacterium]MBU1895066.1 efflux RND transporter periplasmic adaptor subunit [Candidatus Omnitrophota bacterium]